MTPPETYLRRCVELARNGEGHTSPNPMVGCVIVHGDRIVGEGWHHRAGEPHAEVNAIASVKNAEILRDSTLYVNLEPCSHWGKTPPCADLIIGKGIPRVVVGMVDPFAAVAGEGIRKLRAAGIEVTVDVLENECRELNRRFITCHTEKRPYITLKWAQTVDGWLDNNRPATAPAAWMTGPAARVAVHRLRAESDAILTGTNTIARDNPSLTVREDGGKNPIRVVLDRTLRLSPDAHVFDGEAPTLVLTAPERAAEAAERYPKCAVEGVDFSAGWHTILDVLYTRGILSLFVEGGAEILKSLITVGLWDEAYIFVSPLTVAELPNGTADEPPGIKAPAIPGQAASETTLGGTTLYYIKKRDE